MAHGNFKVLDSDIHIIEPPDLWERYMDRRFRGQGPQGLAEYAGDLRMARDGTPWGRHAGDADRSRRREGREHARNVARWRPFEERGWTAKVQLEAMDTEGIDVAVIYPSRGLFALSIPGMHPPLAAAMARAYNDWLYEFCQENPERLLGAGMISPFRIDDAVAETRRCVRELGFRGVFLRPNEVNDRNWHDPYYEPLWAALEELQVPLGFHEGAGSLLRQVGEQFGANTMLKHIYCHPVEQMLAVGSFCAGGILERHPTLRVAFLEGNCSWVPFLLWRMDEHQEWMGDVYAPELTMEPSEYFRRQCFVSVECDEAPVKYVIEAIGDDRLVFSTDFPHGDSKFPRAVESFLELPISEESKRKILWDNCAAYYGVTPAVR
ncbi:MAG TPA: amidohydrolase family protein [Candidatus Methylomirabilis sp.]|nr:amidohydrolase family protein [Candidatus Methylomirabilis sp.]